MPRGAKNAKAGAAGLRFRPPADWPVVPKRPGVGQAPDTTDRDLVVAACIEWIEQTETDVLLAYLPVLARHAEQPEPGA